METTLNIALIGYGAMGKELERIASQSACEVREVYTSSRTLDGITPEQCSWDIAADRKSVV